MHNGWISGNEMVATEIKCKLLVSQFSPTMFHFVSWYWMLARSSKPVNGIEKLINLNI